MVKKKPALGKGIGALISDANEFGPRNANVQFDEVPLKNIETNPFQPRTEFDEDALNDLAESIKKMGVIQPITLRKLDSNKYQLIAGERRFRASTLAGLDSIPAYIRKTEDDELLEIALVENIQREDLNAIEVSLSYQRLKDEFNLTQDEVSNRVGKKRATVSNYLRLLKLPSEVQFAIRDKKMQMGHARALLGLDDPATQLMVLEQILEYDFSVRKVEEIVRNLNDDTSPENFAKPEKSAVPEKYTSFKKALTQSLGKKVGVSVNPKGQGKVTIAFKSDAEFDELMQALNKIQ